MSKQIACILLAAGNGTRFGGDKLLAPVDGKPMITHATALHAALPYALRVAVIRMGDAALQSQFDASRFFIVYNPGPEQGISGSVRIGLTAAMEQAKARGIDLDGALFSVSDQPRLGPATVQRMIDLFSAHSDRIVAPFAEDGRRGNPVIFPAALFSELLLITGDRGGGVVIKKHPELVLPCAADAAELFDVDTPADAVTADSVLARNSCC